MLRKLFSRKEQVPSAMAHAATKVEDDWQLLDEEGECTNFDSSGLEYAHLFAASKEPVKKSDFEQLRVLGKGASALVLLVRYKRNNELYALKMISKPRVLKNAHNVVRERDIMARQGSDFLVKMHYCFQSKTKLFFVLDYMAGGDLYYYTGEWPGGKFDEETARFYAAGVFRGLKELHDQHIIYRDLKPENVLLDADGHPKLADFGLSRELGDDDGRASTFVGTAFYIAPELLRKEKYSFPADWWSYGVLLFNLLTGENPFYGDDVRSIYHAIREKDYEIRSEYKVSAEAKDLVAQLLKKNPDERIDAAGIEGHPWFKGFDWGSLNTGTAPNWKPAEVPNVAMKGATLADDSPSLRDPRVLEANEGQFQGFTLDNAAPSGLDGVDGQ